MDTPISSKLHRCAGGRGLAAVQLATAFEAAAVPPKELSCTHTCTHLSRSLNPHPKQCSSMHRWSGAGSCPAGNSHRCNSGRYRRRPSQALVPASPRRQSGGQFPRHRLCHRSVRCRISACRCRAQLSYFTRCAHASCVRCFLHFLSLFLSALGAMSIALPSLSLPQVCTCIFTRCAHASRKASRVIS